MMGLTKHLKLGCDAGRGTPISPLRRRVLVLSVRNPAALAAAGFAAVMVAPPAAMNAASAAAAGFAAAEAAPAAAAAAPAAPAALASGVCFEEG